MRRVPFAAVLVAACATSQTAAGERRQIDVPLALAPAAAKARVLAAFTADGLAVTESAGEVVTGTYADRLLTVQIRGAIVPVDSAGSRVVLTGFGARPGLGAGVPRAEAQVTSRTGGPGQAAWARMERIAAALR